MGNFLSRLNIRQCADFQRVTIGGIGCVAMIDKSQFALNMDPVYPVQPENVLAVGRGGDTIDDTNDFTGLYVMPGKKPLAME